MDGYISRIVDHRVLYLFINRVSVVEITTCECARILLRELL